MGEIWGIIKCREIINIENFLEKQNIWPVQHTFSNYFNRKISIFANEMAYFDKLYITDQLYDRVFGLRGPIYISLILVIFYLYCVYAA